jgi:hypothetical protein
VSVAAVIFYLIRESYIGELLGSFLPYIVVLWLVCAVIALIIMTVSRQKRTRIVSGISFVILVVMSVWGGGKVYDFYGGIGEVSEFGGIGEVGRFSIFYNNIYVYNEEYEAIENALTAFDPDIVVLVEFARHHRVALEDFLERQ